MTSTQPTNIRDSVNHVKKIADGVVHVSRAIKELQNGELNEHALLVLLAHATKLSQKQIKAVLIGLAELEELYVKPKQKE